MTCITSLKEKETKKKESISQSRKPKNSLASSYSEFKTREQKKSGTKTHTFGKSGKAVMVSLMFLMSIPTCSPTVMAIQETEVSKIVDAIYRIEGGAKTKFPYGIKSIPCKSNEECRRICANTVRNNHKRWIKSGQKTGFLEFLSNRYAPVEAHPLNKHWLPNLESVLEVTK